MVNYDNAYGAYPGMQQVDPIVCPPEYCVHDTFIPREVPVVHPIVNVNRQHFVDVPRHYYTETTENVMGAPMGPGMGPNRGPGNMMNHNHGGCGSQCGGFGRGFGEDERFGWR